MADLFAFDDCGLEPFIVADGVSFVPQVCPLSIVCANLRMQPLASASVCFPGVVRVIAATAWREPFETFEDLSRLFIVLVAACFPCSLFTVSIVAWLTSFCV
jgi:hypothetical protein